MDDHKPWPIYLVIIPNLFIGIVIMISFYFIRKKSQSHLQLERERLLRDRAMRQQFLNGELNMQRNDAAQNNQENDMPHDNQINPDEEDEEGSNRIN